MKGRYKIFLADDDADDVEFFREVLHDIDNSIAFDFAVNGHEALNKLQSDPSAPDLIFLDLNMPRVDGKQCLKELKKHKHLTNVPVLMFTTSSNLRDATEVLKMGAECFITKPTGPQELRNILSSIISNAPDNIVNALRELKNVSTMIHCQR